MKARIGVIGCGWWATRAHVPALLANPDAEIVAIADTDDGNRHRAEQQIGLRSDRAFADAAEMLDQVELDGVVIAVPHAAHASLARLTLEHDVHLLLEKPMTLDPVDARSLAELAATRGRELIIGYPWHYNRQVLAVRDAIGDGRIGSIEFVSCLFASIVRELYRGNPEPYRDVLGYPVNPPGRDTYADPAIAGGGQGQTQITHSAALLFWLTSLRPTHVAAISGSFELAVDLADAVAIKFDSGALGSLGSTGSVLPGQDELLEYRLFGSDGHILFDVNEGVASIHGHDGSIVRLPGPPIEERYPDWAPTDNLVEVILDRAPNGSPPWIGVLTVEFVDAMYRAAREARTIAIAVDLVDSIGAD